MKVIVTSVYDNVDQEWIEWWLNRLASSEVMNGSTSVVKDLKLYGESSFSSKDPSSGVVATTSYRIIK